jgi:impB/mucB/samB family
MGAPIALLDCNNFYASCQRVFQPRLRGKPVVVLSNNDDCVRAPSKPTSYVSGSAVGNERRIFTIAPPWRDGRHQGGT